MNMEMNQEAIEWIIVCILTAQMPAKMLLT